MSEHIYEEVFYGEDSHGNDIDWPTVYRKEEIVRCRDCEHYVKDPNPIDPGWPMMCEDSGRDMVEPWGFCAWSERKSEDD